MISAVTSASENRGRKEGRRSGTGSVLTCGPHMSVAEKEKKRRARALLANGLVVVCCAREGKGRLGWAGPVARLAMFF